MGHTPIEFKVRCPYCTRSWWVDDNGSVRVLGTRPVHPGYVCEDCTEFGDGDYVVGVVTGEWRPTIEDAE